MNDEPASLDEHMFKLERELRGLEHRLLILHSLDSPNSHTMQGELTVRIDEQRHRVASLQPALSISTPGSEPT